MKITKDTMKLIIVSEALLKFKIKILTQQLKSQSYKDFENIMKEFDETLSKLELVTEKSKKQEIDYDKEIEEIFGAVASPQAKQLVDGEADCDAFINKRFNEVV